MTFSTITFLNCLRVSHILYVLLPPTTNGLHVHVDLAILDGYMARSQLR